MDRRPTEQVIELLENAQSLLDVGKKGPNKGKLPMQIEIRTLEFWRAIIAECIATFFYVMLLSSTHQALNHPKDSIATVQMYSAITAGLAMVTLTQAFLQISGSHFNPAITVACALMKKITLLRAAMYICAQCGGAIAGAALVYGVYGRNGAKDQFGQTSIANFGMEFILTFLVAYVFFSISSTSATNRTNSSLQSSLSIGLAYMASLAAYRGSLNPARALGPAFVADAFEFHWVFWVGPILGASCGGFCFTFIFNMKKPRWRREKDGPETLSVKSDEDMLDDLERVRQYKTNMLATYNEGLNGGGVGSVYNTAVKPYKRAGGAESVYGGTKSLYNAPPYGGDGRRTPGFDSKSMYGGYVEDGRHSRAQLKRSFSVHSRVQRRHPQDNLPDEPANYRPNQGRQAPGPEHSRQMSQITDNGANERLEGTAYTSDAMYREYIRQKNAAADQTAPLEQYNSGSSSGQCSGSSSGYYSTAREQEEQRREQLRVDHELIREQKQEHFHRRERSVGSTRGELRREEIRRGGEVPHPAAGAPGDIRGPRAQNYTPSTTSSYGY